MKRFTINENWEFIREDVGADGFLTSAAENITLPHTWNALDGQDGNNDFYRGRCWYRRELELELAPGEEAWIEFEGANSVAEVFINGESVGLHEGGYSTFRFKITRALKAEEKNEILVSVDNSPRPDIYPLMADFTFFGGIYRDAAIITAGNIRFDLDDDGSPGVFVKPLKVEKELAELEIRSLLVFPENPSGELVLQHTLKDDTGKTAASGEENITGNKELISVLKVESPRLWTGREDPYLYRLESVLILDGQPVDSREIPVGIRSLAINPEKGFILNGQPLRLKGMSRHQDRKDKGWAISRENQNEDMEILLEIGANAVRLAHYQHNQYFYNLCDEKGIVAWAEIPFISSMSENDNPGRNAKAQLTELVKQNFNHPSIAFWGIQNEITIGGPDKEIASVVSMLNNTVKSLDTSRITVQAQVGHHPDEDDMNRAADALGYNKYYGWYYGECEDFDTWLSGFASVQPEIPLAISEYGCEGLLQWHSENPVKNDYSEEYQALYHEKVLNIFNKHPRLWATYNWNLFDFASDFRDEGGVKGMNNKGLVTYDRKTRKDSFYWYKVNWSSEPLLHINSRRFVNRASETIDIKVYSNLEGVKLRVNGREIAGPEDLYKNENPRKAWLFRNVPLTMGENTIIAEAGDLKDEVRFIRVSRADESYICPKSENMMDSISNWFEKDGEEDSKPMIFPKGYFSIRDKISKILKVPEGKAVLKALMPEMFDHPMFGIMKAFSFEKLAGMKPEYFPEAFMKKLNRELNKVPKK